MVNVLLIVTVKHNHQRPTNRVIATTVCSTNSYFTCRLVVVIIDKPFQYIKYIIVI